MISALSALAVHLADNDDVMLARKDAVAVVV